MALILREFSLGLPFAAPVRGVMLRSYISSFDVHIAPYRSVCPIFFTTLVHPVAVPSNRSDFGR